MVDQLAGALTFAYFLAGTHFLRFWHRTRDPLFGYFAIAFWLFCLNQLASEVPIFSNETAGYEYLLRAAGFVLILIAIAHKNLPPRS